MIATGAVDQVVKLIEDGSDAAVTCYCELATFDDSHGAMLSNQKNFEIMFEILIQEGDTWAPLKSAMLKV